MTNFEDEWGMLLAPKYAPFTLPIQPTTKGIDEEPAGCIKLNEWWALYLADALDALDQPDAWSGDDETIFQARQKIQEIQALLVSITTLPCTAEPEYITEYIERIVHHYEIVTQDGGGGSCEESEEDDMPQIVLLRFGGVAYLAEPCCSGDTKLYSLQPASMAVSSDGSVKVDAFSDKNDAVTFKPFSATASTKDCFASKATLIFQERLASFAEDATAFVQNIANTALISDDLYQQAALAYELITGQDIDTSMWANTPAEMRQYFKSNDFYMTMIDKWQAEGAVTRNDLLLWAAGVPMYADGNTWTQIVMSPRGLAVDWARFVNVEKLNEELQLALAACEADSSDSWQDDIPLLSDYLYEYEGVTYQVYDYRPNFYMDAEMDWIPSYQPTTNAGGAYACYTVHNTLSGYTRVYLNDNAIQKQDPNATTGFYFHGKTGNDANAKAVAEALVGQTASAFSGTLDSPGFGTGFRVISPSGGILTLERFLIIEPVTP